MPPADPCAKDKKAADRARRAADRAARARDRAFDRWSRESAAAMRERAMVGGCIYVDSGGDVIVDTDCMADHNAEAEDHEEEADDLLDEAQDALEEWQDAEDEAREAAGDYCDCLEEHEED